MYIFSGVRFEFRLAPEVSQSASSLLPVLSLLSVLSVLSGLSVLSLSC
jgi:hypothetical protein